MGGAGGGTWCYVTFGEVFCFVYVLFCFLMVTGTVGMKQSMAADDAEIIF